MAASRPFSFLFFGGAISGSRQYRRFGFEFGGRVKTVEPAPPKNKKEVIFEGALHHKQATPDGVWPLLEN